MKITKGKLLLIIGILVLFLGVPAGIILMSGRTVFKLGASDPNRPENVSVSGITENSAVISWATKGAVQSLVSYGLSISNLTLIQPETAPAINHQIILSRLMSSSNYFFVIKVGGKTFDNNGQPFTFTTLAKETTLPTPTPKPSLAITEQGIETAMGTNNPAYDLNKDGIVNTLDLLLFRQQNKTK